MTSSGMFRVAMTILILPPPPPPPPPVLNCRVCVCVCVFVCKAVAGHVMSRVLGALSCMVQTERGEGERRV